MRRRQASAARADMLGTQRAAHLEQARPSARACVGRCFSISTQGRATQPPAWFTTQSQTMMKGGWYWRVCGLTFAGSARALEFVGASSGRRRSGAADRSAARRARGGLRRGQNVVRSDRLGGGARGRAAGGAPARQQPLPQGLGEASWCSSREHDYVPCSGEIPGCFLQRTAGSCGLCCRHGAHALLLRAAGKGSSSA